MNADILFGLALGVVSMVLLLYIFRDFVFSKFLTNVTLKVEKSDGSLQEVNIQELLDLQDKTHKLLDDTIETLLFSYNDYWTIMNLLDYLEKYTSLSDYNDFLSEFNKHAGERLKVLEKQFKQYGITDYKQIKKGHKDLNNLMKEEEK